MRRRFVRTHDPITGDEFSPGEGLSWALQGIVRRWTFLAVFAAVTAFVWVVGSPAWLGWWNYSASFLAIVIESVVGIGFYNMARRDSSVLREVRGLAQEHVRLLGELAREVDRTTLAADRLEALAESIHDHQLRS